MINQLFPGRTRAKIEQGKHLQRQAKELEDSIRGMDNNPSVDENPKQGRIRFRNQELDSDLISGPLDGFARITDGRIESLELSNSEGESIWYSMGEDGKRSLNRRTAKGTMSVLESSNGAMKVTQARRVDPSTTPNKIKQALKSAGKAGVRALVTAIPLIGASWSMAMNGPSTSHTTHRLVSEFGNMAGTAALAAAAAVGSPVLLGLAGVSLATAGLSAGVQDLKEGYGVQEHPYYVSETWLASPSGDTVAKV
jgi:hypothetical protein